MLKIVLSRISIIILFIFCTSVLLFSNRKLFAQEESKYIPNNRFYSLSNSQNHLSPVYQTTPSVLFSREKMKALEELRKAREINDAIRQKKAELVLNQIDHRTQMTLAPDHRIKIVPPRPISPGGTDYLQHEINPLTNRAASVAVVPPGAPNAGRIWVVSTQYGYAINDTMQYYYSDDGGVSWTQYVSWYYADYFVNYRAGELDLECVFDSSYVWLFTVASFRDTLGRVFCNFARMRTDGNYNLFANTFSFPGFESPSNIYYNPHLTSDNITYRNSSVYLYFTCSFDSAYGSGQHLMSNKFALIAGATGSSTSIYLSQPSGSGFYWTGENYPPSVYWYSDIAYYRTGSTDRVFCTVDQNILFNNLYLAWSDDYGATIAGNLVINETVPTKGAVIASSGLTGSTDMMILYLRQTNPSDWDAAYQWTTTGGTTTGSWTAGYLDNSTNNARGYPDITAVLGTADRFKAAYNEDSSGVRAFYAGWNGSSWSTPSRLSVNGSLCDTVYGKVKASYIPGTSDDCLAIWSGNGGIGLYASTACLSTIGISKNNNRVPEHFSLEQNYPNPFNPSTIINYSIPPLKGDRGMTVQLVIYDLLGQQVASLIPPFWGGQEGLKPGTYSVEWDGTNYSSGVYFYKLVLSGAEGQVFTDVKKMVLVK